MIQELVEYGKRVPEGKRMSVKDGSLTKERVAMCLVIDQRGEFQDFVPYGKDMDAEIITDSNGIIKAKQGSARLLLDKCEEVLGVIVEKRKFESYQKSLQPFREVEALAPIFKFYSSGALRDAIEEYLSLGDVNNDAFITFSIGSFRLLENEEVVNAIKGHISKEIQKHTKGKKQANIEYKEVSFSLEIVIDFNGNFQEIRKVTTQAIQTEVHSEKKKETYFLVGKSEDILGITDERNEKKHRLFLKKLDEYRLDIPALEPVFMFYDENNGKGLKKAISASICKFGKECNQSTYNITFMVGTEPLMCNTDVKSIISRRFKEKEELLVKKHKLVCSICGESSSPILDEPHGVVSMPNGQKAGSALVSYNNSVFMSYGLKGNLNSSICRNCARLYMEGLNFLLTDGHNVPEKEKRPAHFQFHHRADISDSTVALFWTQEETEYNPLLLINPPESSEIIKLFGSVWNGESRIVSIIDSEKFYSCTLSSAAARISVRDWTAISLAEYRINIANWFKDIEIIDNEGNITYSSLYRLVGATQRDKKKGEKPKPDLNSKARIGTILWNAAIKGRLYKIPIEVLQCILKRICVGDYFSSHKAAIIKLIINREKNNSMKSSLDEANRSVAYLCGRLFAVIESMQWMAICNGKKDKKVNNGVKERFFAAAASQPAYVFGTLLTKNVPIYQHKIDGYLAKELKEIAGTISENGSFPQRFIPIEQGEFALGYYFQKTHKQ